MASFKKKIRLTENQKANGFGNSQPDSTRSGFVHIGDLDTVFTNLVATGSSVDFKYRIQTRDIFNNVIDLHTGEFSAADNQIVMIPDSSFEELRTVIEDYSDGALFSSISSKRDGER